jgi:hypothetical protein
MLYNSTDGFVNVEDNYTSTTGYNQGTVTTTGV